MKRFILSPLARKDMRTIWVHSFKNWGRAKANAYILDINVFLAKLADRPALGRACNEIKQDYFKAGIVSHIVFYRLEDEGIFVVRILHQAMDYHRHL